MATNKSTASRVSRNAFGVLVMLSLGGCATFSDDGGFGTVETLTKERINKEATWVRDAESRESVLARVKELLKQPLGIDEAVQIALLNNRGLQANYAELGIAEADLVQAGRLRNPSFSYARLSRTEDGAVEREYERAFMFDLLGLITMPVRTRIEARRFEQAKLQAAIETLRVADEARRTYFSAVAAQETAKYLEQVKLAAEAAAELAQRMAKVGNWSKLQQMRNQTFYAEATAQLARAKQVALSECEKLTRLMGLWGEQLNFQLPERLPELPAIPRELPNVEAQAMQSRLDLVMGRRELEGLASSFGLTKVTRFVNVLEVGYLHNNETDKPRQTGYEIELQIPLFDWGGAKVAKAEALYLQAVDRMAERAINARSEVREAYAAYRTAFDLAKHYRDEIVPLRKKISEENLLRYNGMLIGTFELLADAREQAASVNAYIESLRDYQLAESTLEMALIGKPSGGVSGGAARIAMPVTESGGH